jgi:hypothetical protein
MRGDVERGFIGPLSTSQFLSLAVVLLAGVVLFYARRQGLAAAALIVLASSSGAEAAQRVLQRTRIDGAKQQQPLDSTLVWDKGRLRTDSGPFTSTIMDFAKDRILILDHKKREFSSTPLGTFIEQMKTALTAMRAQMSNLPEDQRGQFGSLFDTRPLDLEASPGEITLFGMKAQRYILHQAGREVGEVVYTREIDISDLAPYTKKMTEAMKGGASGAWSDVLARTENGFPIRSVMSMEVMGQNATYTTEITAHDSPATDEALFSPPKNYKRIGDKPPAVDPHPAK